MSLPRSFKKKAKREAKRMVKRMDWKHESYPGKMDRSTCHMSGYVGLAMWDREENLAGWMLAEERELKKAPGITDHLQTLAANNGLPTLKIAKDQCEQAMIRCIFIDIIKEAENDIKQSADCSEREGEREVTETILPEVNGQGVGSDRTLNSSEGE